MHPHTHSGHSVSKQARGMTEDTLVYSLTCVASTAATVHFVTKYHFEKLSETTSLFKLGCLDLLLLQWFLQSQFAGNGSVVSSVYVWLISGLVVVTWCAMQCCCRLLICCPCSLKNAARVIEAGIHIGSAAMSIDLMVSGFTFYAYSRVASYSVVCLITVALCLYFGRQFRSLLLLELPSVITDWCTVMIFVFLTIYYPCSADIECWIDNAFPPWVIVPLLAIIFLDFFVYNVFMERQHHNPYDPLQ